MHVEDERNLVDACDRLGLANEIKFEVGIETRVDGVRPVGQEKGIPIRLRAYQRLGGDIARRTRTVVDEELVTQTSGQPLCDYSRNDVDLAARGKADDNARGTRRIALRPSETRDARS